MIFLTASTFATDKVEAFELGAAAYLLKPVDCAHLIGVAREILHARRARRTKAPSFGTL